MQKRKELRLTEFNYSEEGLYFITICTKNRECVLSEIKYENDNPKIFLYEVGKIVEKYINSINKTYKDLKICNYIIMPNHIHFIVDIVEGNVSGSPKDTTPTNQKIPFLISTFKRLINREVKIDLWQRNYYEHVIRNEKEYYGILEYIEYNPYNWKKDKYYINK